MPEVIIFPDVVVALGDYLNGEFVDRGETATVCTTLRTPRPDRLVRLRRIAGTRNGPVIDRAMVSVECWALHEEDAHDIAQLVRGLIYAARGTTLGTTVIYHVAEIGGPALLPDPESDAPRYVATYEIGTRGRAA